MGRVRPLHVLATPQMRRVLPIQTRLEGLHVMIPLANAPRSLGGAAP
jgi:hypothetical protein